MSEHSGLDDLRWRHSLWRNRLQSLFLLSVMAGFLALLGELLGGTAGVLLLLFVGASGVAFNPMFSPRLIMRLYGGVPLEPGQSPVLSQLVDHLRHQAGLRRAPDLYWIPSRMVNAFAMGSRRRSAIAVTEGLLHTLGSRELAGVLGHEISHIRNNDLWVMGLADLFSRVTALLALFGQFLILVNLPLLLMSETVISWSVVVLLVLAPNLSALAQLALSRSREYEADLNAARLTGDPDGLAMALEKMERLQGGWLERIVKPGHRVPEPSLLRTHPETAQRVARLRALRPRETVRDRLPLQQGTAGLKGQTTIAEPRWRRHGLWY